ncbi:MAG: hypothetical protein ACU84J_02470 [Gammaproteobacteria bacterium]
MKNNTMQAVHAEDNNGYPGKSSETPKPFGSLKCIGERSLEQYGRRVGCRWVYIVR